MNKQILLKNTSSYKDNLLKRLSDKEFAKTYLETAFEEYEKDKDTHSLLLAMGDVAEAQGGVGKLAKRASITRQHLYNILDSKHNPRLDNWLSIIAGLGFRVRLERQSYAL